MAVNGGEGEGPEAHLLPPSMRQPSRTGDFLGKHRLSAAITRLSQEIQFLETELNELETTETSAEACKEVCSNTEDKSDALLPVTPGPENPAWHRWFQRVRSSQSRKWWTNKGSSDSS
ncbi:guanine nucleotide-binding protein subunit gamma 2-like [Zingiber officinale]|uniref:guanine nucleotide-binding protein subunit gamma 2-like n=1 Tax=Zingiber officinale TaxID=94328 RepID=UPI001C4B45B4|nr:guanine nucleotide-binding protein subunit gamma 2-like [Zingiber officinale]XP_042394559.1 guanine nucleotide-binding protein subunit gamma 2-like [Zingiber officinale]